MYMYVYVCIYTYIFSLSQAVDKKRKAFYQQDALTYAAGAVTPKPVHVREGRGGGSRSEGGRQRARERARDRASVYA